MGYDMLGVVGKSLKMVKLQLTSRNTVAKRTQHVAPNTICVTICYVGTLRSFGRGLIPSKLIHLELFLDYFWLEKSQEDLELANPETRILQRLIVIS